MSEQGEPPAAKRGGATVAVVVGHGLKLNFKKGLDLRDVAVLFGAVSSLPLRRASRLHMQLGNLGTSGERVWAERSLKTQLFSHRRMQA